MPRRSTRVRALIYASVIHRRTQRRRGAHYSRDPQQRRSPCSHAGFRAARADIQSTRWEPRLSNSPLGLRPLSHPAAMFTRHALAESHIIGIHHCPMQYSTERLQIGALPLAFICCHWTYASSNVSGYKPSSREGPRLNRRPANHPAPNIASPILGARDTQSASEHYRNDGVTQ